jgi:uncharacterized protein (TIGR03435 family)
MGAQRRRAGADACITILAIALTASNTAAREQQQARSSFEAVSIRPSPSESAPRISARFTGSHFEISTATAQELVRRAFNVESFRVIAPDWARKRLFDLRAVAPAGATERDIPGMLRQVLEERFALRMHVEKRPFPVYVLSVGPSGPSFREVDPSQPFEPVIDSPRTGSGTIGGVKGDEQRRVITQEGTAVMTPQTSHRTRYLDDGSIELDAMRITMEEFIGQLWGVGRPVVNRTGLTGTYTFKTVLPPPQLKGMDQLLAVRGVTLDPSGSSLTNVMEKLGLKIVPTDDLLDAIVIDRIEPPTPD